MLDREGDTHLYLQIAEILRDRLSRANPGDRVPSEADLQREFGVARTSARRAVQLLRHEGLIHTIQGDGTFVGGPGQAPRRQRTTPMYQQIANDLSTRIQAGGLQPRRRIPAETTLVQEYGVARETVRHAMTLLRQQGWIYTVAARGSYVCPRELWPS